MAKKIVAKPKTETKVKKPASSYIFFTKSLREKHNAEGKNTKNVTEFTKIAGSEWKALTSAEKKPYEDMAKAAKDKFNKDVADGKIVLEKRNRKTKAGGKAKKVTDPNAPKKPKNAFFFFVEDYRTKMKAEGKSGGGNALSSSASEKWKTMTVDEKNVYQLKADNDKTRYKTDMQSYKGSSGSSSNANSRGRKPVVECSEDEDEEEEEDDDDDKMPFDAEHYKRESLTRRGADLGTNKPPNKEGERDCPHSDESDDDEEDEEEDA